MSEDMEKVEVFQCAFEPKDRLEVNAATSLEGGTIIDVYTRAGYGGGAALTRADTLRLIAVLQAIVGEAP